MSTIYYNIIQNNSDQLINNDLYFVNDRRRRQCKQKTISRYISLFKVIKNKIIF